MEFFRTYAKELIALLVPVITGIINWLFRSSVRLIYSTPHGFTFLVQQPLIDPQGTVIKQTQTVHTRSYFFQNGGRGTAHHVEIVFNWKPPFMNIWPSRHYEEKTEVDSRYVLFFDSLAPRENFGLELLSINQDLPDLITVRCDEGMGRKVTMYPQQVLANWIIVTLRALLFVGFVSSIYLVIVLLQWLVLRTPLAL